MSESTERWRKIDELFNAALDLPSAERSAFLDEACGGDAELRATLDRLLAESASEDPLLSTGAPLRGVLGGDLDNEIERSNAPSLVGTRLGNYRLAEEIGRGGTAVVYRATRDDGQFEQQVAVKVLQPGYASQELRRRFAQERQILAHLDHPGIARLYDGGVLEDGRPYFVMERVDGRPIDRYADKRRASVEERLRLFLEVGRAVAAAHRNLIVHRDIKPSNILVRRDGQVKLLDFGIAKWLDASFDPGLTRATQRMMTPEYASPEQIRGEPMSTAADVYQLGLLLYKLLTGRRPYKERPSTPTEWARLICEQEPTRPSAAVAALDGAATRDLSRTRRTAPERLRRALVGDLDHIVLKALRKEPEKRYGSVEGMLDDVERFLDGRPVRARCGTWRYLAGKFLRRHRAAMAAFAAVLLLISGLVAFYTARLSAERDRARLETRKAERVAGLLSDLFRGSDPFTNNAEPDLTARQLLDRGAARVSAELGAEPLVAADLNATIGDVYRGLGLYDEARPLLESALERREELLGPDHPDVAESLADYALLLKNLRFYRDAIPLYERALDIRERQLGNADPKVGETLQQLAVVVRYADSAEKARPLSERALRVLEGALGPDHPRLADALSSHGLLLRELEDWSAARMAFERSLEIRERALDERHPLLAESLNNLALLEKSVGNLAASRRHYERAIALEESALGPMHADLAFTLTGYADLLYLDFGDALAARPVYERVVEIRRHNLGDDHSFVALAVHNLTRLLVDVGEYRAAEPLLREALENARETHPPGHWITLNLLFGLAESLAALDRPAEAEPFALEAWELFEDSPYFETAKEEAAELMIELYESWGRPEKAEAYRGYLNARPDSAPPDPRR